MAVVTVNGREISQEDVDRTVEKLLVEYEDRIPPDQADQARPMLTKQAVESLVNQSLLLEEAERKEIAVDDQAVKARLDEISKRFPKGEEFQQVLETMGLSMDSFREELHRNMKIEVLLSQDVGEPENVTDADVETFYKENPDSFKVPERVRASHILISMDPSESDDVRTRKRLELSSIRGEIEKGGDFAKLAGQHSTCPSKSQGGDLGFFERGKMVKPFEDAAFSMKAGEVSEIVETQFGVHLIKKTEHQEPGMLDLEQIRENVAKFLNRQRSDEKIGEFVTKLRDAATIEYAEGTQP